MLSYFTFLDREEISALEEKWLQKPYKREAQIRLAEIGDSLRSRKALEDTKENYKRTLQETCSNTNELDEIEQGQNMPT